MNTVGVVATIKAKIGKEKELETILLKLVEQTHKEPGCLIYALNRSQNNASTFIFIEKWASVNALQAHLQSSHIGEAMQRKDELIESLDISPLIPLGQDSNGKSAF